MFLRRIGNCQWLQLPEPFLFINMAQSATGISRFLFIKRFELGSRAKRRDNVFMLSTSLTSVNPSVRAFL